MTFWASKSGNDNKNVDVQITYGIISVKVTEDAGHLRSFHRELGKLLDEVEQDKAAE